jgi:hypothetical protein
MWNKAFTESFVKSFTESNSTSFVYAGSHTTTTDSS